MYSKIVCLKEKTNKQILLYAAISVLLFFGINSLMEFATDTYATFEEPGTWKWMLYENGRVISGLIYYLVEKIGLSNGIIYYLSYAAALFFLWLALCIVSHILTKYIENDIFTCLLLAIITIMNPFFIEYFLFIEKGLFMLAILSNTVAFAVIEHYFYKRKRRMLLYAAIALSVAVFIYQITLGLFVLLCLPFILRYSKNIKNFLINNFIVAGLYGGTVLFAFFITKVFLRSSRMDEVGGVFENIVSVMRYIMEISTRRFFHVDNWGITVLTVILIVLICMVVEHKSGYLPYWGSLIYILTGCVVVGFFPIITGVTQYNSIRIIYPYGCILGIILIWCSMNFNRMKIEKALVLIFLIFFLLFQYRDFQKVFIGRYQCNQADRYLCEIIGARIDEYEQSQGIEIQTICFYRDQLETWWDKGYDFSELNVRAQSCGWSNLNAINYYLDEEYVKGEPNSFYEEYFKQFNWDTYTEEQLIFEGDILHICIY